MKSRWILVCSRPQREKLACINIARQNHQYYCPQFQESKVLNGRRIERIRPLFPRYIFVLINGHWRFLNGTYGVSKVVQFGDEPVKVPEEVIQDLKSRERDGLVKLPKVVDQKFIHGEKVRVTNGPFVGYIGLHDQSTDNHRERVLLDVLDRKVPVTLFADDLEVYSES